MNDFEIIRTIGVGNYGSVQLARKKFNEQNFYAIKRISQFTVSQIYTLNWLIKDYL